MKEDAKRMAVSAMQRTHSMAHVGAVEAACAADGTIPRGDDDRLSLRGDDDVRCALRAWSLFDQHQFPPA